ncbi:TerB family tellurite resistance protein [Sneathiella sp. HT1-7]|uniref:TerB family tellurite resistance protein n=1 Tax=Sneathiella sp. HT1-7 TaxID=2887192 RepID=UPI001D147E57|nr:TerB family tellurite resistance protein [Sneathiella sp. HT1-7]MCC3306643.1 TerB family tellurite resistance protein [Sneathiella sp. HT1-7]
MAIWGKILGGAAGLLVGGPLGALVGGLAGHAVDKYRETTSGDEEIGQHHVKQVAFTIAVIALGAKMAKADGVVTREEIDVFKRVFRIPPNEEKNVGRVFNMARQDTAGYEEYAAQVARMFHDTPRMMEDLLHGLFAIAMADGVLHPDEDIYLQNVAAIFGFNEAAYARIRSYHAKDGEGDPYQILGVSADISDQDLKKAYRQLIRENHPDKVIADGLPQEFVDVANAKLAKINAAYDQIEKIRSL